MNMISKVKLFMATLLNQVFVSSLVPNAPVKLSNVDVTTENKAVSNSEILTIGTCSFRLDYLSSPLLSTNGSSPLTPGSKVGSFD